MSGNSKSQEEKIDKNAMVDTESRSDNAAGTASDTADKSKNDADEKSFIKEKSKGHKGDDDNDNKGKDDASSSGSIEPKRKVVYRIVTGRRRNEDDQEDKTDSSSQSSDTSLTPPTGLLWTILWPSLQDLGWAYINIGTQGKWCYIRPNSTTLNNSNKNNGDNQTPKSKFDNVESVIEYIKKENPELLDDAVAKIQKETKEATRRRKSTTVKTPSKNINEASNDDATKITPMNVYTQISEPLRELGWKIVRGTGIISWFYTAPNVTIKTGTVGIDVFDSVESLILHLIRQDSMQALMEKALSNLGITVDQYLEMHGGHIVDEFAPYRITGRKSSGRVPVSAKKDQPSNQEDVGSQSAVKKRVRSGKSTDNKVGKKKSESKIDNMEVEEETRNLNKSDDDTIVASNEIKDRLSEKPKKKQKTSDKRVEVALSPIAATPKLPKSPKAPSVPLSSENNQPDEQQNSNTLISEPEKNSLMTKSSTTAASPTTTSTNAIVTTALVASNEKIGSTGNLSDKPNSNKNRITYQSVVANEGSSIFKDMKFDITSLQVDHISPDSPTQQELVTLIIKHGGSTLFPQDRKESRPSNASNQKQSVVYSISAPMNYRTPRYLQLVAKKIPVLHFVWIYKSIIEKKVLPWNHFILPAGLSLVRDSFVFPPEWEDFIDASKSTQQIPRYPLPIPRIRRVLNEVKCALVLYGRTEIAVKSLLSEAGATVIPVNQADNTTTIAICDANDSSKSTIETCKKLAALGVAIVSLDWVTMSITDGIVHYPKSKEFPKSSCTYGNSEWPLLQSEVAWKVIQNSPSSSSNDTTSFAKKEEVWIGPPKEITSDNRTKYFTCHVKGSRMDEGDFVRFVSKIQIIKEASLENENEDGVNFMGKSESSNMEETFVRFGRIKEFYENSQGEHRAFIQELDVIEPESDDKPVKLKASGCNIDIPLSLLLGKFVCVKEQDAKVLGYSTSQVYWRQRVFVLV